MYRKDRLIQEYAHDPYFTKKKFHDPSICKQCGVVFHNGIFEWMDNPLPEAEKIVCPACKRIEEKYEGGLVVLEGGYFVKHKNEIKNIIKNTEAVEIKQRPLERIIEIVEEELGMKVTTTYEHLSRRIGEAVHKACKGSLTIQYPEGEKYVRVHWKRDT